MNLLKKSEKFITLAEAEEILSKLKIPMQLVFTPINLVEERERFFDSDSYEPQFRYRIVKNDNKSLFSRLKEVTGISDVDPAISAFYIELIQAKIESDLLMNSAGNNAVVTEISKKRWGNITPILFKNACLVLKGKVDSYKLIEKSKVKRAQSEKKLDFLEVKNYFKERLVDIGLGEWEIIMSKNSTDSVVKLGPKSREIYISQNISKTESQLKKTFIHEIYTHAYRSINGFATGVGALGKSNLPSYLDVEEGLAIYNEELYGLLTEKQLRSIALQLYAAKVGENFSFRQLYDVLCGFTGRKTAFNIALRMKRGLGDTSKPGLYYKDCSYFRGFRRVRNRIAKDKSLYTKLYAGKIGFKQLQWVDDGVIPKAQLLPPALGNL